MTRDPIYFKSCSAINHGEPICIDHGGLEGNCIRKAGSATKAGLDLEAAYLK